MLNILGQNVNLIFLAMSCLEKYWKKRAPHYPQAYERCFNLEDQELSKIKTRI